MLAELEIKGGYIEPTNRGDPTLKASKKQGAKIIDSTTRLPKDLDPFE